MINDLTSSTCPLYKYVDDTNVLHISDQPQSQDLQQAADQVVQWSQKNDMVINPIKTKELLIDFSRTKFTDFSQITVSGSAIDRVNESKILGVIVSNDLKWNGHVDAITGKAGQRLHMLTNLKKAGVPKCDIVNMYISKIRSLLEYACEAWHPGLCDYLTSDIERIQKRAMYIIYPEKTYDDALKDSNLKHLAQRRDEMCEQFFKKMQQPDHKLNHLVPESKIHRYNIRRKSEYESPKLMTIRARGSLVNWCLHRQMSL